MLIIKEVATQEQYDALKEKQDASTNTYLYILKFSKQNVYVNQKGEFVLGNSEETELLRQEIKTLGSILDSINRVVI